MVGILQLQYNVNDTRTDFVRLCLPVEDAAIRQNIT